MAGGRSREGTHGSFLLKLKIRHCRMLPVPVFAGVQHRASELSNSLGLFL
jgi:hypothetical protein